MMYATSASGLNTARIVLNTIENNIANANTPGYNREIAQVQENPASGQYGVQSEYGTGSRVANVQQVKSSYLDQQVYTETGKSNYYQTLNQLLTQVQSAFAEGSGNPGALSNTLSNFFSAFQEASNFPSQTSYRQALLSSAQDLTGQFNAVANELNTVASGVDSSIVSTVQQVNQITKKIAEINGKIAGSENSASQNTLSDQRSQLVVALSKMVDVTVVQDPSNANVIDIQSGGTSLVTGNQSNPLQANYNQSAGKWQFTGSTSLIYNPTGGSLAGYIATRNNYLSNYSATLNTFATTLMSNVNSLASAGYGLDNSTGNTIFTGTTAATMAVNSTLLNNPAKVPLASSPNQPGNGSVAMQISNLQNQNIYNGGTTNPLDYYNTFINQMGNNLNAVTKNETTHQQVLASVTAQQQSIEGVNIDQEMTNLLNYQQMYDSNAKAIQLETSMFQSLLQIMP